MKTGLIRVITTQAITIGVSGVVGTVLSSFKPDNLKTIEKVSFAVGSYAIGAMAGAAAANYVNEQVDEVLGVIDNLKYVMKKKEMDESTSIS